ncbi:MAG: TldD/PmbA family protein [Chloroflexi bacterium]|nr:TldD/PmbA family protein [Chloroflexota bacterium]
MTLLGQDELTRIAEAALHHATGDAAEAVVIVRTGALTRFANAAIHQNMVSREVDLRVRVAVGKRVAIVATNRVDPEGIAQAARDASELARLSPENERFAGIPEPRPIPPAPSAYRARTEAATPLDRARLAKVICDASLAKGLRAAGFVSTDTQEILVANSRGVRAYTPQTIAEAQAAVIGDEGSSFAQRVTLDVADCDAQAVADEAVAKAILAQRPRDHPLGPTEVVLEAYAVRDIIGFLGSQLTGMAVEEGRSFVGGRLGERVTGSLTFTDDAFDPQGVSRPFDFEGQPTERLVLIDKGISRAVVYDAASALRAGTRPTGHALPPNRFAPASAMSLRLEAGERSREELIRGVKRGVLVTRFWYTRWVHQLRTIVTGMTRDGVFAIEDGEIAYPVKNFRFTQSYHEALASVQGVGKDLSLLVGAEQFGLSLSWNRVPALHLGTFAFTGATQH